MSASSVGVAGAPAGGGPGSTSVSDSSPTAAAPGTAGAAIRGIVTVLSPGTGICRLTVSSFPRPVNQAPRQYSRSCTNALAVW